MNKNKQSDYEAIVVGASAGGMRAFLRLFARFTDYFSVPVILVQHRSKDKKELLEEVLRNKFSLVIKQADEKEKILGGQVYIAPPDYHLMVEKDKTFSLSSDAPVHFSRPSIDVLFETAAEVYGKRLIGILLTGSNADGAHGIKAIFDSGGLTLVQDPHEAEFSIMPTAAIKTNSVTHILTLEEISNFLTQILDNGEIRYSK